MLSVTLPILYPIVLLCFTKHSIAGFLDNSTASYVCLQNSDGTCEKCIQSHPYCSWCTDINYTQERCNIRENLMKSKCREDTIYSAENSNMQNDGKKNLTFQDPNEKKNQPAVQIRPQELNIQLRLKEPVTFQLQYKAALDYPLDLYYLMDLTYSMQEDVQTMITLGSVMSEFLQSLTKTYKIGFGYFMDKVAMPYSMTAQKYFENPCGLEQKTCGKAFDFVHSLNFTENIDEFIKKLNSSEVSANRDNLEGGGDALMQIMVCKDNIKWRTYSRKIIIVATNGYFHFSGDGILAGVVQKNPGICMLTSNGTYTGALLYDYPSLEEIYRKLLQYKVNLLFAAKNEVYSYYQLLHDTIPTVTYIGLLEQKSTNVLSLIEKSYTEVVSNVRFEANVPDGVKVTFKSTCNKPELKGVLNETNSCDNIKIGDVYTFDVTLELESLPDRISDTIIIEEMNLAENVKLNIEYVGIECYCKAQNTQNSCSNNGEFRCGKCNCYEGWTGESCEIECRQNACRFSNETYTSSTCYQHGDCDRSTCKCVCDYNYMGPFCEYNQCSRNARTREVCSNNGICEKGICHCFVDYERDDCSCYKKSDRCIIPGLSDICSGVGTCDCGKCTCPSNYTGQYCEYCPSCTKICESYNECIIATVNNVTTHSCTQNDAVYTTQRVETVNDKCLARYINNEEINCEVRYTYIVTGGKINLKYIDPYCPRTFVASMKSYSVLLILLLVGAVLFALFIWKVYTQRKDKAETEKFMKEVLNSTFANNENPIYNSPVRKYFNPLNSENFGGEVFEMNSKID